MTIKKVLKSLQMTGHALRLDVESIAAFNKWIANPESVVLGGFCSDFSIEGKFHVLTKGSTDLSIPYNLKITASDITYGLIEVEKYNISNNGRRFKVYRSRIKKAEILIKKAEPILRLSAN